MKKLLISTSASALFVAMGGAMAQSGAVGAEADLGLHAAADQITCEEIAGLDDEAASQVLYFVAGYQEGHRTGMEFGAAPGDELLDDDDVAADLGTEPDDDLAATDPMDDDLTDDDLAAAPDLDDPATDDDLAATDPFEDDVMADDDIAEAPDLDDPATDDLAADDPMVDPEITAAIGTEAEGVVGIDFDVQQVMTACADNPTMTVAAAIEQERGMGLEPDADLTDN
jgi:hypothetical protein